MGRPKRTDRGNCNCGVALGPGQDQFCSRRCKALSRAGVPWGKGRVQDPCTPATAQRLIDLINSDHHARVKLWSLIDSNRATQAEHNHKRMLCRRSKV